MKFEERKLKFQEGLEKLMGEFGIDIYPANVVMPSGEVMPMIKMADLKEEELIVKKDEDKPKK